MEEKHRKKSVNQKQVTRERKKQNTIFKFNKRKRGKGTGYAICESI